MLASFLMRPTIDGGLLAAFFFFSLLTVVIASELRYVNQNFNVYFVSLLLVASACLLVFIVRPDLYYFRYLMFFSSPEPLAQNGLL